jgi:hypothetical protein
MRHGTKSVAEGQIFPPPIEVIRDGLDLYGIVVHLISNIEVDVEIIKIRSRQFPLLELDPHLPVQVFELVHEPRHVEKRARISASPKPLTQGLKQAALASHCDGALDEFLG